MLYLTFSMLACGVHINVTLMMYAMIDPLTDAQTRYGTDSQEADTEVAVR